LLPEPGRWLRGWRGVVSMLEEQALETLDAFDEAQRKPGMLTASRTRLAAQLALTERMVVEIKSILAPLGPPARSDAVVEGYRPLESLHLLHRDWGWADSEENARALGCIDRVVDGPLGRTLVIGAGAGRLAYDLSVKHRASLVVAIDIDPLVSLVAARIASGECVTLTEGNASAIHLSALDAERTLSAPDGPAPSLHFMLANGLEPPFRPASFDTIVTPWFIDLVPPDLREFLGVLERLLVPGGRWVHYGPLLYPPSRAVGCRFTAEEIVQLAALAGFEVGEPHVELMPFALSPLCGRGRLETCFAFAASYVGVRRCTEMPPWLILPYLPIPVLTKTPPSTMSAAERLVISLVDGVRSIDDITREVVAHTKTTVAGVKDSIRYCLAKLHDEARSCHPAALAPQRSPVLGAVKMNAVAQDFDMSLDFRATGTEEGA
jgi:hypothetical protein